MIDKTGLINNLKYSYRELKTNYHFIEINLTHNLNYFRDFEKNNKNLIKNEK